MLKSEVSFKMFTSFKFKYIFYRKFFTKEKNRRRKLNKSRINSTSSLASSTWSLNMFILLFYYVLFMLYGVECNDNLYHRKTRNLHYTNNYFSDNSNQFVNYLTFKGNLMHLLHLRGYGQSFIIIIIIIKNYNLKIKM